MPPLSAGELLVGYADRSLSPAEVVADLGAAIEADGHGAFWATCLERAGEEARNSSERWARGEARPLEGVPIAVKDLFDTEGVETTYGSGMFRGHVPARDAEAVRRVRAAGAIVIGKTATHEFAWGFSSINDALGTVRNPLDPERVAGGSSGGSGAALAAGLVPLALGTDTGGSIRVPSAFCGVHGLKPTWGRVSLEGVWPLARTLDHAGPMARTAADVARLYAVLGWAAVRSERGIHADGPVRAGDVGPLDGLMVGLCPDLDLVAPGHDVDAARAATAGALAARGAGIVDVALPEATTLAAAYAPIQLAEALQAHRRAGLYPDRRAEYGDDVGGRLDMATEVGADALLDAAHGREVVRAGFARAFETADVLLTPVHPGPPPLIEEERRTRDLRHAVAPCCIPQDLVGLPACAFPAGIDAGGLPIGLQLTGPPGSEAVLLALVRALES